MHTKISKSRQFRLKVPARVPVGKARIVMFIYPESKNSHVNRSTGKDFLESKLCGLWKDRKDIKDPLEYAKVLRKRAMRVHAY